MLNPSRKMPQAGLSACQHVPRIQFFKSGLRTNLSVPFRATPPSLRHLDLPDRNLPWTDPDPGIPGKAE